MLFVFSLFFLFFRIKTKFSKTVIKQDPIFFVPKKKEICCPNTAFLSLNMSKFSLEFYVFGKYFSIAFDGIPT